MILSLECSSIDMNFLCNFNAINRFGPLPLVFSFFTLPHAPLKVLFAILSSACPVSTKCSFIRADVVNSIANISMASLETRKAKQIFRFDLSPFPESFFADFFKEY